MTRFTVVFAGVLDGKRLEDFTIDGATAVAYWDGDAIRQQVCFQDFCAEIEDLCAEVARLREALEKISKLEDVTVSDFDGTEWEHQRISRAALAEKEEK